MVCISHVDGGSEAEGTRLMLVGAFFFVVEGPFVDDSGSYESDESLAGGIHMARHGHTRVAGAQLRSRSIIPKLWHYWEVAGRWLSAHATQPVWLPAAWRLSWVSYGCAVVLTTGVGILLTVLAVATSGAVLAASPLLLVDVVVALAFGTGPSLLSALLGTLLLDYFILLPHFAWSHTDPGKAVTILLFAIVGCAISLLASRIEHARAQKEALAEALCASEQETVRRMDEFLAVAGHELKTPLTSLLAHLQLAERKLRAMDDTLRAPGSDIDVAKLEKNRTQLATMLEQSLHQARRQNRLIGDLLDMSRARADKLHLELETHDLIAVVSDRVEEQRQLHPYRQIGMHLAVSNRVTRMPVVMDADRIGQVLANYLGNAIKYSPDGSPVVVTISQEVDAEDCLWARVAVRDDGTGIPAEVREKIWERFFRVPGVQPQSALDVGLGLGLYISRQIVERHGGRVGVESIEGKGTTFWFAIPACIAYEEDMHERQITGG